LLPIVAKKGASGPKPGSSLIEAYKGEASSTEWVG